MADTRPEWTEVIPTDDALVAWLKAGAWHDKERGTVHLASRDTRESSTSTRTVSPANASRAAREMGYPHFHGIGKHTGFLIYGKTDKEW